MPEKVVPKKAVPKAAPKAVPKVVPKKVKVVIDPVTRIEGHLKIEVEVEGGKVINARSSGTMHRGIETILQGRNPVDPHVLVPRV